MTQPSATSQPTVIGMILFPNLTQLDLTGPYEVLSSVPNTRIHLIAHDLKPVRSERGMQIVPDTTLDNAPALDMLMVPGGPGVNPMIEDAALIRFLREQGATARYVTSVCTGALLLGAAGLLRGYRATTHWMSIDLLPIFGAIPVSGERVVIDRNRITGGGVTAGIDFGLTVAAELAGAEVAQQIQLMIEYNPSPPFNSGSSTTAPKSVVKALTERSQARQEQRRARLEAIMAKQG